MSIAMIDKPRTFLYRLAHGVVRLFFRIFYHIRVEGLEHIPVKGPVILASNHTSNLDPPLIGICVPRYIRFMGKAELFSVPLIGKMLLHLGGFPIRRGRIDKAAIRTAMRVVADGGCLVMFPEGRRSKTGELGPFLPGVGSIAKKANSPVVPVAIRGPYRLFGSVRVIFSEPIYPDNFVDPSLSEELRARIQQCLR